LLPDQIVLVFTPNRQSLIGGINAIAHAVRYRRESNDIRPLMIFPLPSRIDVSEPELLEKWRFGDPDHLEDPKGYQSRLEDACASLYDLSSCSLRTYFDEIQIQHVPRYSYGEEIAVRTERTHRLSLSRSYYAFSNVLANLASPWTLKSTDIGPATQLSVEASDSQKVNDAKEYIAQERLKLKLHDLLAKEIQVAITSAKSGTFTTPIPWSPENFALRLHQYENVCADLIKLQAVIGFWGGATHRSLITMPAKRLCDQIEPQSGLTTYLALRWYPGLLLMYSGGIAAVAANNYENLYTLMLTPLPNISKLEGRETNLVLSTGKATADLHGAFKTLAGFERQLVPRSEYMFKYLQPLLDDLLYLSSDYEPAFDRFEMLFALQHAYLREKQSGGFWGPPGRFIWGRSHLDELVEEGKTQGATWDLLKAGLFGGSIETFFKVADIYREDIQKRSLAW
jgi:hypothetical protein